MKNITTIAVISTLLFGATAQAGQIEIDQIEQATSVLDIKTLQSLSTKTTGYDQAFANYRLAISANVTKDKDLALTASNKAIEQLEQITKQEPEHIEAKALLAQLYGYKISLQPYKAMLLGPKSVNELEAAETMAPNNPRVQLFKGVNKANTPAMFGGSVDEAISAFNAAIVAYDADDYSGYHWGEAEAYTWRGLMYQSQGNHTQAKADWQQAIAVEPGYGWATSLLKKSQ